jgi:hypothetical protein
MDFRKEIMSGNFDDYPNSSRKIAEEGTYMLLSEIEENVREVIVNTCFEFGKNIESYLKTHLPSIGLELTEFWGDSYNTWGYSFRGEQVEQEYFFINYDIALPEYGKSSGRTDIPLFLQSAGKNRGMVEPFATISVNSTPVEAANDIIDGLSKISWNEL